MLIGDEEYVADAGSWVIKPRAIPHTYWNTGPNPARLIEIISPAGFEGFFRDPLIVRDRELRGSF